MPETAVIVDSAHPLVKEPALDLVLLSVLALRFKNETVARIEPDEEVRPVLSDDAPVDIKNLESQVIVLDPGGDVRVTVDRESFGRFPGAVIDAEIDVRMVRALAWLARIPGPHISRRADGTRAVKDGFKPFSVLEADSLADMLNDLRHVERDD